MAELGEKRRRVTFHVTGFGKFNGVPKNPTTEIIDNLSAYIAEHPFTSDDSTVGSATVLETSAVGSLEALKSMQARACLTVGEGLDCGRTVFIHLGVDAKSSCFKLESRAYNEVDFRVPDERQYQPSHVPIVPTVSTDTGMFFETEICLPNLLGALNSTEMCTQKEECGAVTVCSSDDAGRFVCNWVYFNSLHWCRTQDPVSPESYTALFVHVPPFDVVGLQSQLAFIRCMLDLLAQQLAAEQ